MKKILSILLLSVLIISLLIIPSLGYSINFFMILEIDPLVILIICLAFSLGGFIKGMASFGLPMVTVPVLSEAFSVPVALALTAVPILLSNVYLIKQSKLLRVTLQRFWPLITALVITLLFSTQLLLELNSATLMVIVGCCLLLFVLSNVSKTLILFSLFPDSKIFMISSKLLTHFYFILKNP